MIVKSINLKDYRNYELLNIELSDKTNIIYGDNAQGKTITLTFQMEDKPGLLADVLKIVAAYGANILTIHQSIPINGIATLTLSVEILPEAGDAEDMIGQMEQQTGVHYLKILGRE